MKYILLLLISSHTFASSGFIATSEGDVISDRISDLSVQPSFEWKIDPFLKLPGYTNFSSAKQEELILQATMPEGKEPMAVVNDHVVHLGDKIGKKIVFRIGNNFLLLKEGESITEINIFENDSLEFEKEKPASSSSNDSGSIDIHEVD